LAAVTELGVAIQQQRALAVLAAVMVAVQGVFILAARQHQGKVTTAATAVAHLTAAVAEAVQGQWVVMLVEMLMVTAATGLLHLFLVLQLLTLVVVVLAETEMILQGALAALAEAAQGLTLLVLLKLELLIQAAAAAAAVLVTRLPLMAVQVS
jgi:hypothetical protein